MLKLLLNLVENIEKRPSMYLIKPDFNSLSNFLAGYVSAMSDITGISYHYHLSIWINNRKGGKRTSIIWSHYILLFLAKNDEEQAYKLMFKVLKEFIADCEKNNLHDVPTRSDLL